MIAMRTRVDTCSLAFALVLFTVLGVGGSAFPETQPITSNWLALRRQAAREFKAGRHRQSLPILKAAIKTAEFANVDKCTRADMLDALAKVYRVLDDRVQEEVCLRASLRLRQEARWPEHPDVRNTRILLALSLAEQYKASEAEIYVKKELAIENELNDGAIASPRLLELIGDLEYKQKKYIDAMKHFESLTAMEESRAEPREAQLRRFLNRLCDIYKALGKPAELTRVTKKIVALDDKTPDLDTGRKATDLYEMALANPSIPEKIASLQQAYRLIKQDNSLALLRVWILASLSDAMLSQHDLTFAEKYALEAYNNTLKINPINKRLLMLIAAKLGLLYKTTNRTDDAIKFFKIAFKNVETPDLDIAGWHYNLGLVYGSRKNIMLAKEEYEEAVSTLDKIGPQGPGGDQVRVWCDSALATCYEIQSNWSQSLRLRREALELAQKLNDQSLIGTCELNLAHVYRANGDIPYTQKLVLSSIEKLKRQPDERLIDALWLLASTYADRGDIEKAKETKQRIESDSKSWSAAMKKSNDDRSKQFQSRYHF